MKICKSRLFIPFYFVLLLFIGTLLKHFDLVEAQNGPGPIANFEIIPINSENEFTLTFTYLKHPTDPDEKALRYYIYGANSIETLENGNRELFLQVNSPKEPGTKESFNLEIYDAETEQMYFQIVAISSYGVIVQSNIVDVNNIKLPNVPIPQVIFKEINYYTFEVNITVPFINHASDEAMVSKFLIFGSEQETIGVNNAQFLLELNNRKSRGDFNTVLVDVPTNTDIYYLSVSPVYKKYRSEWDSQLIFNRTFTTTTTPEQTTVTFPQFPPPVHDDVDDTPWIKTTVGIVTVCAGVAVVLAAVLALHLFIKNRKK